MRICITHSRKHAFSETFIRGQIAQLGQLAEVCTIQSGRYPERKEDGTLLSPGLYHILHKALKPIIGRNNFFSDYGVKKYLKDQRVDVVIANFGMSAAHMVPPCKALGIPLIPVFRGHDATDIKLLREYAARYHALFEYAASIVAVSEALKSKLVALGADPAKVHVIPSGVDTSKFTPAPHAVQEKAVLAVGRFTEKKGPLHTLRAFRKVLEEFPDATLTMVGAKSGLFARCEQLVNDLGMAGSVRFTGVLPHPEVAGLMRNSLMFVQHSVTADNGDMEGTPGGIMEASASGLPVVSTRHGGIPEAVIHGTTGFLVAEKDEDSMAEFMIRLCGDPDLARQMGLEGRRHMQANYEQKALIRKQYELAVAAVEAKSGQ